MYLSEAINSFFGYHRINSKKNTIRNYEMILTRFLKHLGDMEIKSFRGKHKGKHKGSGLHF